MQPPKGGATMSGANICKFISPTVSDTLSVSCFVLEADTSVMKNGCTLLEHRAILVTCGSGEFIFNGKHFPFTAGTLAFGFKDETFSVDRIGEGTQYMYVSFDGGRADELFRRFDIHTSSRAFDGFDGLIPLWSDSLSRASELTVDLASESILLYTFSRLFSNTVQNSGIVGKMLSMTDEQFTNPELSLATVADALSYNAKYLSHLFKEKTGVGYNEYLRDTRIKFAVSLLERGLDSVKNVALLSGFTDPLYFSSVFKKIMGVSPAAYVKSKR